MWHMYINMQRSFQYQLTNIYSFEFCPLIYICMSDLLVIIVIKFTILS